MNDTETLTLTDFLLARIAEDEGVAKEARAHEYLSPARDASPLRWVRDTLGYGTIFANSGRVLAECEAKRRIVELRYSWNLQAEGSSEPPFGPILKTQVVTADTVLRTLATVYADHPDYRPEWTV